MKKKWGIKPVELGTTIIEMTVSVVILSIIMLSVPISLRLVNDMQYTQKKSQTQTQVQNILREITHQIRNSPRVNVLTYPEDEDGVVPFTEFKDSLVIDRYDIKRYGAHDINMFREDFYCPSSPTPFNCVEKYPTAEGCNWGRTIYRLANEKIDHKDWDGDGKQTDEDFLLEYTTWQYTKAQEDDGCPGNKLQRKVGPDFVSFPPTLNVSIKKHLVGQIVRDKTLLFTHADDDNHSIQIQLKVNMGYHSKGSPHVYTAVATSRHKLELEG
jgi:type II secretory pathway pseudopilin PulG